MDLIYRLVQNVLDIEYKDLSPETVTAAKRVVMDTLGTTIAGSCAQGCSDLVQLVKDWGGKEESSILVYGGRVSIPNSVLVNCTMAWAWDFDDSYEAGGSHASASIVPSCLALAEYSPRRISGKEFLLAISLGIDLQCRLRRSLIPPRVWPSETFAPFGVVAAAGKLLGFDMETMLRGMGIALIWHGVFLLVSHHLNKRKSWLMLPIKLCKKELRKLVLATDYLTSHLQYRKKLKNMGLVLFAILLDMVLEKICMKSLK